MPMVFISFALPLRAEDLGASAFEIGILFSIYTASVFILRPIVGVALDRYGRKPFFIAALILYFCINILYSLAGGLEGLFIARLLHGIGFAFLSITTDTITADLTEQQDRAASMGGNIESQSRGGMVGAIIGFTLVGAIPVHAWVYSFTSFAVFAFLAIIFALIAIPETNPAKHVEHEKVPLIITPTLRRLLIVVTFVAFSGALTQPYFFIYLRDRFDLELGALAFAFLPLGLAYAILPSKLGKWTSNLPRATATSIGLGIGGCLYFLVPHAPNLIMVVLVLTSSAAGVMLAELTKNAWVADIAHKHAVGRAYGVAALCAGIGGTIAPIFGGIIYDRLGQEYLFYSNGILLLIATAIAFFFVEAGKNTQ